MRTGTGGAKWGFVFVMIANAPPLGAAILCKSLIPVIKGGRLCYHCILIDVYLGACAYIGKGVPI